MKDKISLIVPNLAGGGAERVMVSLANNFTMKGISTDLVIVNNSDMYYESELSDKVNLVNLQKKRVINSIPSLKRYFVETKPSAVVSTLTHMTSATYLAIGISGLKGVRFFPREDRAPIKVSFRNPYLYLLSFLTKKAYRKANGIISLSDDMAAELRRFYALETPIHTIYNPMDIDKIIDLSVQMPFPALPWSGDTKFVLGAGRLTDQKDFPTLLKAIAKVRESHDVKLVILGEGPNRLSLESQALGLGIRDSLFMPGFVKNPFAFMSAAEVFVLSSVNEGLPNTLIQAQICGVNCISTDCPTGPREVLQDGANGELVDIGDYDTIANAIMRSLGNRSKGAMAVKELRQRYGAEIIADKYLEVLMSG